jgi:hypothetical protein
MNNQNTNELIKKVAYEVTFLTGLWGIIVTSSSLALIEYYNPLSIRYNQPHMAFTLPFVGVVTTAIVVYGYSS